MSLSNGISSTGAAHTTICEGWTEVAFPQSSGGPASRSLNPNFSEQTLRNLPGLFEHKLCWMQKEN